MSKWMSVLALGAAMLIVGCHHDKDDMNNSSGSMSDTKKMSMSNGAACDKSSQKCAACDASKAK